MKTVSIRGLELKSGSHASPEAGMCVMEAVAYFAGEKHSDRPECACPVLTSYMITINDNMTTEERKVLKPYIKKLIGTRDGNSQKRVDIFVRASIAEFTAGALRLTGVAELIDHANKLEAIADTGTMKELESAAESAARSAARSAESAAESAARSAARSAESAAWSAARSAAESETTVKAKATARLKFWKKALKALDRALAVK